MVEDKPYCNIKLISWGCDYEAAVDPNSYKEFSKEFRCSLLF